MDPSAAKRPNCARANWRAASAAWWTPPKTSGAATVRTFGQVAEVITLGNNGAYGLHDGYDMGFHVAALC